MHKLWGIRHIRYWYLSYKLNCHIRMCREYGLGFFAQESDLQYLDDIWSGNK